MWQWMAWRQHDPRGSAPRGYGWLCWIAGLCWWPVMVPAAEAPATGEVQQYQRALVSAAADVQLKLPDLSGYTEPAIRQQLGRWHGRPAELVQERLVGKVEIRKFFSAGRLVTWSRRQNQFPRIVMIRHGLATLAQLSRSMPDVVVDQGQGRYIARLPLAVAADGGLLIDKGQTLLLSEERGAFIVNAGQFYLLHGQLLGWREDTGKPATFVDKHDFRPFYTAWSNSDTYIYGSTVAHLGSSSSKAYGLTLSSYTEADEAFAPMKIDRHKPPRGWILGNRFEDMFYGFYCYEAADIAVIGNEYAKNIYYGIDPHDRSHRLIIANNHVWGSKVRHGIIVSRDVSDSFIFRNISHDNANSGIMLDRQSNRNVVAQNVSYHNGGDGIVLYESDDTLIFANQVYRNAHHGIRFRNSRHVRMVDNLVVSNARFGIYGQLRDLDHSGRDLKLDPYLRRTSGLVAGGLLSGNRSGTIFVDKPDYLKIQGVSMNPQYDSRGRIKDGLEGTLASYRAEIMAAVANPQQQWVLAQPGALPSGGQ